MEVLRFIYRNLDYFKRKFFVVFVTGILYGLVAFLIPALFTNQQFSLNNGAPGVI